MKRLVITYLGVSLLIPFTAYADSESVGAETIGFNTLAQQCAPQVHMDTLQAIARTESHFNPYAIGVVDGAVKQPKNLADAIAVAKALHAEGKNFSLGLAQINKKNLARFGLSYDTVFDPCVNLKTGAEILSECYSRAKGSPQEALQKALSCYYSGNFKTGFTEDFPGLPSYVERIKAAARKNTSEQKIVTEVPAIDVDATSPAKATIQTAKLSGTTQSPSHKEVAVNQPNKSEKLAAWDAFGDW